MSRSCFSPARTQNAHADRSASLTADSLSAAECDRGDVVGPVRLPGDTFTIGAADPDAAARTSTTADSSSGNQGFRLAYDVENR